jgi:hypothetical protein
MFVHWLVPGVYKSLEDLLSSNLASIRMRAGLVGKYSQDLQIQFSAGDHINSNTDVIVIGKIGGDCQNGRDEFWIKQLSEAKKQSKKVILDYTDHHLESASSPMGNFYKNVLPLIDKVVVPSNRIATLLKPFVDIEITVIEDPVEIQTILPRPSVYVGEPVLLWFGHATNIPYLLSYLQNNHLCDVSFKLIILSNGPGLEMVASNQHRLSVSIRVELAEWSLQNMINASNVSHGCLIPSDLCDLRKSGASSNRLITAFALGLPVSADVLESYAPFSDFFHKIRELPLSVFVNQLAFYTKKVELAQASVVPMFSQDALAKKWKHFLLASPSNKR